MTRPRERADLDVLLDALLPFAQDMLRQRGAFRPFGATMNPAGDITLAAAEAADPSSVIDMMVRGMRKQASTGVIRATGICFDARKTDADAGMASDAIAVSLEHAAGDTVLVHMPYSRGRLSGWKFGDLTCGPSAQRIFSSD